MSSLTVIEGDAFTTPKKDNEVFRSRYFSHSEKKIDNPEVVQTFFNNSPFQKFYKDISVLRPISYECPNNRLLQRHYIVVEEKISYGRPLTQKEMQQLRLRRKVDPQVITWGKGSMIKDRNVRASSVVRDQRAPPTLVRNDGVTLRRSVIVDRQAQQKGSFWCCSTGQNKDTRKALVNSMW